MLDLTYIAPADFGRYALQSDGEMDDRPTSTSQKSTPSSIPPLMSLSVTPPAVPASVQPKSTASTSVVKENIEPLPFPQQSPGPIRRPTKLPCSSNLQSSTLFSDSMQSPGTPDVLAQINHLLDHQNSINLPSTSSLSGAASSSTLMQDMSSPNVSWTPFMPADWSSKYEATWPMGNMPSPDISLTTSMPNPFAVRASAKEGTAVWPTALGTATPRSTPLATRAQPGAEWNGLFPSSSSAAPPPPSTEPTKSAADAWPKFLPAPESPSPSGAAWWPKPPSDEATEPKDQSRWDFAN